MHTEGLGCLELAARGAATDRPRRARQVVTNNGDTLPKFQKLIDNAGAQRQNELREHSQLRGEVRLDDRLDEQDSVNCIGKTG